MTPMSLGFLFGRRKRKGAGLSWFDRIASAPGRNPEADPEPPVIADYPKHFKLVWAIVITALCLPIWILLPKVGFVLWGLGLWAIFVGF